MSTWRKFVCVHGVLQRRKEMVPIWMLRTAGPGRASSVPLNGLKPSSIHGCSVMNVIRKLIERAESDGEKGPLASWKAELAEKTTGRTRVPCPRSEERRVGKERSAERAGGHDKK